jgi:hypothetical protein
MDRARPHFLGIGAPKAGTTWLWSQLQRHPEVWLTPRKEIHFFDRSTRYPSPNRLATASFKQRLLGSKKWERPEVVRGLAAIAYNAILGRFRTAAWWSDWTFGYYDENWYVNLFSQAGPDQICGEISPSYSILYPEEVSRIKAVNPDVRIIFMIRDPIDREWSGLRYHVSRTTKKEGVGSVDYFMDRLTRTRKTAIVRGDYASTVDNYLQFFDSSQILICFYDAIANDPEGLMHSITSFLGIRHFPADAVDSKTLVNASPKLDMPEQIRDYLVEMYSPMLTCLSKRFGSYASGWEARYSAASDHDIGNTKLVGPPTFHP